MKIPRLFPILLLLGPLLSTVACTTKSVEVSNADAGPQQTATSTPSGSHDAASFCAALCDRQQECDKALDHQTCKNECNNQQAASFPKLRADVVDLVVACLAEKDCKSVLNGNVVSTCAAEAVASVAPSDAATKYCDAFDKAKKKCGTTAAKAACLEQAKLYDDDAIAQAQNCTARPCTEIDTCVGAAFGGFAGSKTPTKPPAPSTCSTGQFSDLGSCSSCAAGPCCSEAAACAEDSTCRSLMQVCSAYGSSCPYQMQSASTSTQQLVGAYFKCAKTRCGTGCGYNGQ